MNLPPKYSPKDVESKWYAIWEKNGFFTPKMDESVPRDKRFTIVIPPPNVTGILHMGHALNNSIQDILIRFERMRGKKALWIPGVDHAGIATQNVVERKLAKEKKTRHDLGREKFIEEVWKWKEEHGSTIVRQLRRLGSSCDWSRERFTMDEGLSRAVRECFVSLYEKGLVYQGHYIINWCPRCQTALSDEEVIHKDVEGALYYIRYPIEGIDVSVTNHFVVATTRPETLLGDTAVAVNSKDVRYQNLIGKYAILPLMNRRIPIIGDDFVDPDFGTGVVKVTPAHDPNDFAIRERHPEIDFVNVLTPDGKINEKGGAYQGLDRFEARKKIVEDLEAQNLFVKRISHTHAVGHCYRCNTVVEPYLSKQWFVRMKPMAERAIQIHREGKTKFVPERWNKVYLNWLNGIRDWCISRQIWWGHQIPVWYCQNTVIASTGGAKQSHDRQIASTSFGTLPRNDECSKPIVSRTDITECPHCKSKEIKRDPDVLDTWFSSWLWPFSTLGWPEKTKDLDYFYPTSVLVTAPEIIFFWVARMIMAGLQFTDKEPFHTIYIHGTVRTDSGQKMSKSLGNALDPIVIIDEIGADALRFSVLMLTASGQDAFLSKEKFDLGRNFTNKIWNAARYVLTDFEKAGTVRLNFDSLSIFDQWILTELNETIQNVTKNIEEYRFNDAATAIYQFFWNSFCDWYLELTKSALGGSESKERQETVRSVLAVVLDSSLRLLSPFMPFITEELWQALQKYVIASTEGAKQSGDREIASAAPRNDTRPKSAMLADWPKMDESLNYPNEAKEVRLFQEAVTGIRDIRSRLGLSPKELLEVLVVSKSEQVLAQVRKFENQIAQLAKTKNVQWLSAIQKKPGMIGKVYSNLEIYVTGIDQTNLKAEEEKTKKRITELETYIQSIAQKLENKNFVERAPQELVDEQREKKENAEKELIIHKENLSILIGS